MFSRVPGVVDAPGLSRHSPDRGFCTDPSDRTRHCLVKRFLDTWLTDSNGMKFDERRRAFLTGFGAKITEANAARLAQEATRSVKVDDGFDVVAFAQRFKGPVRVRTAQIPWEPPTWSRSTYDTAEVHKFVARYFAGEPVQKVHEAPQPDADGCVY